tara:strand:+ start:1299 stop:1481 length:183 start_codon:yes stop_codon:yes gene_type:complete
MTDFCTQTNNREKRREIYQRRKLNWLRLFRDGLERRLAAVNATIITLENQIERDSNTENT